MIRFFLHKFPESLFFLSLSLLGGAFFLDQLWFLALAGFIPVFYLLHHTQKKARLLIALAFGVCYAEILGFPFFSFATINGIPMTHSVRFWVLGGVFAYLFLNGIIAGFLLWAVFALCKNPYLRSLAVPIAWMIFEAILVRLNNGAEWGMIGESLVPFQWLRMWVSLGGTVLLSGIVLLVNSAGYEGLAYFFAEGAKPNMRRTLAVFAPVLIILMMLLGGGFLLSRITTNVFRGEFRAAIIQPNYHGVWSNEYYAELQKNSRELLKNMRVSVDLVIYPSLYMGFLKKEEITPERMRQAFGTIFSKTEYLMFGFSLVENNRIYSAEALVDRAGNVQVRKKEKLFFLSDYVPGFLRKIIPGLSNYTLSYSIPESPDPWFQIREGKVAAFICSEGLAPSLASRARDDHIGLIVITGSNADFSNRFIHRETLRLARIRAVESSAYVLQAMKTGISAVIDPRGEIKESIDKDERGVIVYEIPKLF